MLHGVDSATLCIGIPSPSLGSSDGILGLLWVEDDEVIGVADVDTLKEHRSQYSVLLTIGNVLRPAGWGHEGNFPNDAAAKRHVLRRQDSERPARTTYLRSLKLGSLEQRLF